MSKELFKSKELFNPIPTDSEVKGGQKRRTEFNSSAEKLGYDAAGLITLARKRYGRDVTVAEALDFRSRNNPLSGVDNDVEGLRRAIAIEIKTEPQMELAPDVDWRLRASFDSDMAIWESLGLFAPERESRGYSKPAFDEYRAGFARHQKLTAPGGPKELNKGYDTVNFVPMDVPLISEDPEVQTMFSMLERTLRQEFARAGQDKPANSLVIKTRRGERKVLTKREVYLDEILWTWQEGYLKQRMVHRPAALTKIGHGGSSESELLEQGTDIEKKNGGFMRLERSAIILPQDIGREKMSGQDWMAEKEKSILQGVELQTAHDGIAFMIQFIKKHHYIPDAWTGKEENSQVALMPETYFPDEGSSGAVAAAYFVVSDRRFNLGRTDADDLYSGYGVRGGVRIN